MQCMAKVLYLEIPTDTFSGLRTAVQNVISMNQPT